MKILYLVPHVPNPTKARSYQQIRGLLNAGHEITVATVERNQRDQRRIADLEKMGVYVLSFRLTRIQAALNSLFAFLSAAPLQARFMWSKTFSQTLKEFLCTHPPDIIHVEHLRMARYGLEFVKDWPVVWDAVDHLSTLYTQAKSSGASPILRMISAIEAPRLHHYEPWLTEQFPLTVVISKQDQQLFQQHNPAGERIKVIPHGLPLENPLPNISRAEATLIITGALDYHPNISSVLYFVREIFPLIAQQYPGIKLQLVGSNPVPAIQVLQSIQIQVTGFVPSVSNYLQNATIALAPILYGSGIQIKTIEAFSTATPLVATTTALRGLDVTPEEHVLVGDTPEAFAQAVLSLLANPERRQQLGAAGRKYVEQNHDLVKTTEQLVQVYQRVRALKGLPAL